MKTTLCVFLSLHVMFSLSLCDSVNGSFPMGVVVTCKGNGVGVTWKLCYRVIFINLIYQ